MTSLYINQCLNELSARTESKDLVQICEKFKNELQNNKISESSVLKYLSKRLKNSKDTAVIGKCFTKVILQLVSKIIPLKPFVKKVDIPEPNDESSRLEHLDNCIVFGILAGHPDILQYSLKYFKLNDVAPFEVDIDAADEIPTTPKKAKRQKVNKQQLEYNMVSCCHQLLKSAPFEFSSRWNWSLFIYQFHDSENVEIKCLVKECIVILTGMTEVQADNLSNKLGISADNSIEWTLKSNGLKQIEKELTQNDNSAEPVNIDAKNVINIDGIMLSVYDEYNVKAGPLIPVKSTLDNLKSVSLAIASGKAVCLMGPVGSGKTALVEHLASITGRKGTAFRKVQLGDQTDSRMLLGTYQCTDIPGEFVWRPGVLTEAVQDGHWLLLEDIDCAALDVASVLSSLLERNILSVPGYRDSLQVAPGFQLFLTQRTVATIYGYQKRTTNASTLLQKHWTQINVEPLSRSELIDIVQKIYPQLTTIADRMIQVFMMFSVGSHDSSLQNTSEADENSTSLVKLNFRYGRLISTRDLMKWCLRTIVNFDVSSPESALKVLQDAIDIFTCSIPDPLLRLDLAKKISTQLGIVETRSEYFCKTYKPTISLNPCQCSFGRAVVQRKEVALTDLSLNKGRTVFSFTRPSTCLLERIACCVVAHEPVLLVGETGTGKTSSVQYLAKQAGHKLIVINMNQQSDSADLLGGFKPVDMKFVITPVRNEFEELFMSYFDSAKNTKFLQHIYNCYSRGEWSILVTLMKQTQKAAMKRLVKETNVKTHAEFFLRWQGIGLKLNKLELQIKAASSLTFAFIEGSLIKAMQKGDWVLLDEINLASAEILECLSGLLDDSVELIEKGDKIPIKKHEDFTLFACMNPATDVGKKELPVGLRNRFTEFFVDELVDRNDLILLVGDYLYNMNLSGNILDAIYLFYTKVKKEASLTLVDGAGHAPHYSLRTLCRALSAAAKANCGTLARSLYESFCLSFLTQLDSRSHPVVEAMIAKAVLGKKGLKAVMNQPIPEPVSKNQTYLLFEGHWIPQGKNPITIQDGYVLTPTVRKNLRDIARIISLGQLPVLLQGDTSVGKTSLILYIARASGNQCVRINNHEHTDLQEYVGSYATDNNGKLVFKEGVLVEAMRKGYWIILDELNLAPSDVLEALNRVLDDNRELYIPETQETVKAHANFMLFATQNPPGLYGGRKMLSRAFRNRFVELHFDEIPRLELETILHKRCHMPMSYCKKMISVMAELQLRRRGSAAVQGKDGFITLRDLFRWGQRYKLAAKDTQREGTYYDWDQHIADEGYLVLAGKVRQVDERDIIREVLQKHIKRVVDPNNLFTLSESTSTVTKTILESILNNPLEQFVHIVWTYNMRRLAVLIAKSFIFVEPVLLVGETGCGKTTICQVLAALNKSTLLSVNCHMHTESSDFLGGLRPARDKSDGKLFEWIDGPLIIAMRQGYMFLSDEISLADDSVLERLNSLLEPERQLLLAEKGSDSEGDSVTVTATEGFHFIGTMNPGGDYGKKELSPALRNRFTEIWCDNVSSREDLLQVLERSVSKEFSFGNQEDDTSGIGKSILDFVDWLKKSEISRRFPCSIRDLLSWVNFINATVSKNLLNIPEAYVHGACLTFLDCFGTALTGHVEPKELNYLKLKAIDFLFNQIKNIDDNNLDHLRDMLSNRKCPYTAQLVDGTFGIKPFFIPIGTKLQDMDIDISQSSYNKNDELKFTFTAPTTGGNTLRLLRGLQLNKAILLEGNPGVGKTSLVTALAKASGHNIVRINLSDQTDITDLFGTDLPTEDGSFTFKEGVFLTAWKNGDWILLDELNLAPQPVLEGLNACLDHRGEIYIPELGKSFTVKQDTRLFACQNPLKQGGARRGLPLSFLNRFTQVYIDTLTSDDLMFIAKSQYPTIPTDILEKIVKFNCRISHEITFLQLWGHKGGPWEMNFRDIQRWCDALLSDQTDGCINLKPGKVVDLLYITRMRSEEDRNKIIGIYKEIFYPDYPLSALNPMLYVNDKNIFIGDVSVERREESTSKIIKNNLLILRSQLPTVKSLVRCVKMNWLSILVGPAATGKSDLVQSLAALLGHELKILPVTSAMDVTDLLGGFEQVDYNRNLETIFTAVEEIGIETIKHHCLEGAFDDASHLMKEFYKYKQLDVRENDEAHTLGAETSIFKEKAAFLLDTCKNLSKWNKDNETVTRKLDVLIQRVISLTRIVTDLNTVNAGGKFEWVDSLLVKSILEGSWLLMDNVNLTSSAVLDRLNSLLEPNGVLSIPERGENSELKPHPDFRIFFTMDPKYGEISRAMRNRGVEIYILQAEEYGQSIVDKLPYLDLTALISSTGLPSIYHTMCVTAHESMSSYIQGLEKPNLPHLLQAAYLTQQQLVRGIALTTAVVNSFSDVYVKPRCGADFSSDSGDLAYVKNLMLKNLRDIVHTHTQDENTLKNLTNSDHTLKVPELVKNSSYEMVKQTSFWPVQIYTNYVKTIKHFEQFFHHLFVCYQSTPKSDLKLLNKHIHLMITTSSNKVNTKAAFAINDTAFRTTTSLQGTGHLTTPADPRFYPEIIQQVGEADTNCINKHMILLYFTLLKTQTMINMQTPRTQFSALDYASKVADGTLSDDFAEYPVLKYCKKIIDAFDLHFCKIFKLENTVLSNETCIKLLQALNWRSRFVKICHLPIFTQTPGEKSLPKLNEDMVIRINLHLYWLKKHIEENVSLLTEDEIGDEFLRLLENFKLTDSTSKSPLLHISKGLRKRIGQPLLKADEGDYQRAKSRSQLLDQLSFTRIAPKTLSVVHVAGDISLHKHILYNLTTLSDECDVEFCDNLQLAIVDIIKQEKTNPSVLTDSKVQMRPLNSYIILKAIGLLENQILSILHNSPNVDINYDLLTQNNTFKFNKDLFTHTTHTCMEINTVPPALSNLLMYFDKKSDPNLSIDTFGTFSSIYSQFWDNLYNYAEVSPATNPIPYFTWTSSKQTSDKEIAIEVQGAPLKELSVTTPLLVPYVLKLAGGALENAGNITLTCPTVSIEHSENYKQILDNLLTVLWKNLGVLEISNMTQTISNATLAIRNYEFTLLMLTLSLKKYIPESEPEIQYTTEECTAVCQKCFTNFFDSRTSEELVQLLNEGTELFDSVKSIISNRGDKCCNSNVIEELNLKIMSTRLSVIRSIWLVRLMTEINIVDPVEKNALKLNYIDEDIEYLNSLLNAYYLQGIVTGSVLNKSGEIILKTTNNIFEGIEDEDNIKEMSSDCEVVHPFCKLLVDAREQTRNTIKKYAYGHTYRPESPSYLTFAKDCKHFATTLISAPVIMVHYNRLSDLFANLNKALLNEINLKLYVDNGKNTLNKITTWLYSTKSFYEQVREQYSDAFPDLALPLMNAIAHIRHSMKGLADIGREIITKIELAGSKISSINMLVEDLIRFPSMTRRCEDSLEFVQGFCSDDFTKLLNRPNVLTGSLPQVESFRMLKMTLQECKNYCSSLGMLSENSLNCVSSALDALVGIWEQQVKVIKQKEMDEDNLYVTKSKCETVDEETQIINEISEMFPSYADQDFYEFKGPTLEQKIIPKLKENKLTDSEIDIISPDDITMIYKWHSEFIQTFTRAEWLKRDKGKTGFDHLSPLFERYKIFNNLMDNIFWALDSKLEGAVSPSLMVLISEVKKEISGDAELMSSSKPDFYIAPWVQEVRQCLPVLKHVEEHTNDLLNQWPDFPTLKDIMVIVRRLLDFPVTSPIARFLTGIELLREKLQEWNKNAHKGNNLMESSLMVAQIIINWRKLEMSHWKESLNSVVKTKQSESHKYWFYMFDVIMSYIKTDVESDLSTRESELEAVLQQFIEKANLAEFEVRLDILFSFHCHAVNMERSKRRDKIIAILWNIYKYYSQFSTQVSNHIKEKRAPIEKKLRDYVKITSWDRDLSYWSVRDTVIKAYKVLHKHIKEFEKVLKEPASTCFFINPVLDAASNHLGLWDRPKRNSTSPLLGSGGSYMVDLPIYLSRNIKKYFETEIEGLGGLATGKASLLQKAPTLFNKAKKLCKETILQAPYPILVQSLDDFVTDVIEVSAHLGSLEVPTDVPKQKQVSQAKNFLQQKRKALSDLFKTLQRMGLSYKLGLALLNKKEQLEDFTAAPLDVEVALSYLKHSRRSDASMSSVWTGCEMYFQRNIARQRHLFAALRTPAADLGAQNADRCKGYAANLLDLTQHQKSNITQNMRDMCNLRVLLNNVNAMLEQPSSAARQPDLRHSTLQLNRLCANILITLQQFHVLLNSCPQKTNVLNETEPNYDALLSDSPVVKCYKYSDAWTKLYDRVKILITSTNKQSAILQKSLTHLPSVYDADLNLEETMLPFINIDIVNEAIQHINSVKEEILIMVSEYEFKFKSSEVERFQPEHPLLRSLSELVYIINDVLRSINEETFSKPVENENKYGFHDFAKESDELIESILLVIQKIYKRHLPENTDKIADSSRIEENGITNGVEETEQQIGDNLDESDKYTIWEKHLKLYLQELLSSDVQDLSVNKIVCESAKLVSAFTQFGADSEQQDSFQSVLSRLVPMLEQLALFVQYFVTQQVAAHRVSCKMLSVMLKIFMDLATKGFCKPAGLDLDEGEGEGGPGRLSGGTGLGEGEGKTDVSDQIENQDQLDDAKRPEDYDKKEEDKDCKEEEKGVNMTDDFDSHLQNVDKKEGDGNSDEEEDENPDKQMGDTEPGADRLDQQIWGSDDEDEDSENEEQNKKDQEEKGTGESVGEKEMAAKEDKDNEKAEEDEGGKKDKKKKEKDINKMDEPEIDDDHIDPYHGNEPQLPEPEDLDLPDNMNLDDDNQDDLEGETESENPFEIDKMTDQPEMEDKEQEEEQKEGEGKSTADKKEEHGQELSSDEEEDGDKDADEGDSKMDVDEDGDTGDKEEEEEEKSTEDGGKDAGQDEEQPQEEDGTEPDTLPQVSGQPDEPIQEEEKEEGQETPEENEKIEENPQANPSLDKPTPENNAESADTDKGTDDNIQTNPDIEKDEEAAPYEQAQEQDGDERNATGQAEVNESQSGHQGPRDREKDTAQLRQDKRPRDKEQNKQRNKPGETEQNRTLGEVQEPAQKKMKTLNLQGEDNSKDEEKEDEGVGENEEEEKEADMYQHIKQANKKDVQVMDAATREQAEEQPCPNKDDEEVTDEPKPDEDIEMDVEDTRGEEELVPEQLLSEKVETKNKDKKKPEVGGEDAVTGETSVEVEGDNVATENVPRGAENTYHTNYEDASSMSYQELDMPLEQSMSLRQWLTCAGGAGAGASAGAGAGVWRDLWQQTSGQARQLSERLRLVLEPTGRSRLAGDFRTGRRINMRRVIPYIASHFRKDRIWLRRTKPAKRNYHIAVAVDDSSSMADNRSKELAFESLALVSQALNLLESGDLAVLSFGENPQVLHPFTEQFSEQSGAKILDKLLFNQTKTKIAQLVDFASVLFEQQTNTSDAVNAKLLVVVSDGCGIFSEGEAKVVQAVRRAKQLGIFLVYVIIDNPDNKDSIMDIRRPMFNPVTGALDCFTSYLDTFPFPFYLILRDITALPTVLGDALRQWFELAANNTHSI